MGIVCYYGAMKPPTNLDNFVERIMRINEQRIGIYGGGGSGGDVLLSLRQNVVAFVNEHRKPKPDHNALVSLSQKIEGCLQTLQVLNTLTAAEADKLIDDLRALE